MRKQQELKRNSLSSNSIRNKILDTTIKPAVGALCDSNEMSTQRLTLAVGCKAKNYGKVTDNTFLLLKSQMLE